MSSRSEPIDRPYWLFALFALYGPSINIVGELRYVEMVLVGLLLLSLRRAINSVGLLETRVILAFLLAAAAQFSSDLVNDAVLAGTWKRAGTYILLAIVVLAVQWLARNDPRRIRLILAGYCLSYVFILFVGTSTSAGYAVAPWRLGLGQAVTLFLCVMIARFPRFERLGGLGLLVVAAIHVGFGARTLAAATAVTGALVLFTQVNPVRLPPPFRAKRVFVIVTLGLLGIGVGAYGAKVATDNKLFPEQLQIRMERQFSNPYGLLPAARPDTVAAIYAVTKRPWLGFGSTGFDHEVYRLYVKLSSSSYIEPSIIEGVRIQMFGWDWNHGIPSHSHLFGAWVDAGLAAAVCWLIVLGLAFYVLARSMFWRNAQSALFVFVAIMTIWDTLFSPGPHRMDVAMKLMVLSYAVHQFRGFDSLRRGRTAPGGTASYERRRASSGETSGRLERAV